uniref:S-adenosylmethionine mitochondrial carrier protein n=1 Tax=Syphacia muris TaxID=451379 RepID=A0A0N5AWR2_9BILA
MDHKNEKGMVRSLCAGAVAGLTVDLGLYPIDTLKTRLQSAKGFLASGGFRNVYRGMSSVALGSAPGSALFFCTYVTTKNLFKRENSLIDACGACVGETFACTVRVPTELIKQRAQAKHSANISHICRLIFKNEGFFGFYRGYLSTVSREIPFSLIEFPLWEAFKKLFSRYTNRECSPFESAACGSVAGSIAGAITTPLDVAKTRIMLDETLKQPKISTTLLHIFRRGGIVELYSGVLPRTAWLGFGGFLFFGAFENALKLTYFIVPS